ncbi:hypothetical protein GJ496_005730 [Pomphorhynchus laevis]|nr:hypothetical protein GJ496_005730 [Pomphorhynchus laevis]
MKTESYELRTILNTKFHLEEMSLEELTTFMSFALKPLNVKELSFQIFRMLPKTVSKNISTSTFSKFMVEVTKSNFKEKAWMMYRLYDFDRDGVLKESDIRKAVKMILNIRELDFLLNTNFYKQRVAEILKTMKREDSDSISFDDFYLGLKSVKHLANFLLPIPSTNALPV